MSTNSLPPLHSTIVKVTEQIAKRSQKTRQAYLKQMAMAAQNNQSREQLSCGNLAHAYAGSKDRDKSILRVSSNVNIAIVSAYNDMLSAHKPFELYPQLIREALNTINCAKHQKKDFV